MVHDSPDRVRNVVPVEVPRVPGVEDDARLPDEREIGRQTAVELDEDALIDLERRIVRVPGSGAVCLDPGDGVLVVDDDRDVPERDVTADEDDSQIYGEVARSRVVECGINPVPHVQGIRCKLPGKVRVRQVAVRVVAVVRAEHERRVPGNERLVVGERYVLDVELPDRVVDLRPRGPVQALGDFHSNLRGARGHAGVDCYAREVCDPHRSG